MNSLISLPYLQKMYKYRELRMAMHTQGTYNGLGTVWKRPSKQLLHRTLLLRTIFCSALGLYRRPSTSPSNDVAKQSSHFHQFCAKFNFVWGRRGGVTSFSNITGKVPTLLTSIVGSASDWSCHVENLLQPIKGITQIWVVTRRQ